MESHGSESYFVLDEGLLADSVGGREPTLAAAEEDQVPPFRFTRMGPKGTGHQLSDPILKKTAIAMTAGGGGSSQVPAGFTYLGQFVDHDLTFDKIKVTLGQNISPPSSSRRARRASTLIASTVPDQRIPHRRSSMRQMDFT